MRLLLSRAHGAKVLLVAIAYVAAAKGGLALAYENSSVTAVWAPTGIALAALVLGGWRLWPGVAIGALVANLGTGVPAETVLGITAGNTLEALAGACLLRAAGFDPAMARRRDVLALVLLAGALSTLVSATIGVLSLRLGGALAAGSEISAWRTWWLGDMGGVLLVTPLLLALSRFRIASAIALRPPRLAEAAAVTATAIAVSVAVFSGSDPLAYLVLPLLILAALRFRQAGAAVSSFAVAVVAIGLTAAGLGPFVQSSPDASLLLSQSFLAVGAAIALLLAAVASEHAHAQTALQLARDELELKVRERTATLARTQERLVEAQSLARIGSWQWDIVADTVTWSDELYRIYGVDRAEHAATFAGYLERVHPADRERVQAAVGSALAGGSSFAFDERIVRPGGEIRTLDSRGRVFRGDDGRPVRMVGICQDVTESRRSERALRDSEERSRLIVDGASDAFVATDSGDLVTDWNAQAQALFGWTREEAAGALFADLVIPVRLRARHRARMRSAAEGESPDWMGHRIERVAQHRDGHEFPVELTISSVLTERGATFNMFVHDITERVRRERFLATEHAVSQALLDARTLDEARPRVLEALCTGLDWSIGAWWSMDLPGGVIRCDRVWCAPALEAALFEQVSMERRLVPGVGLPGRVWAAAEAVVVESIAGDPQFTRKEAAGAAGLTAAIGVPVVIGGDVAGVLEFFSADALHLGDELGEMMARLSERVGLYVERQVAANALREAQERFHRAFEDAATGMALIGVSDAQAGRLLEVNDALAALTHYPRAELLGMKVAAITHPEDGARDAAEVHRLIAGEIASIHGETRLVNALGDIVWVTFSTSVIRDAAGQPLYRIAQLQDLTERKRFEDQLQHLADHDPITGLFNRRRFEDEVARELAAAERYATGGAVLALDLDNFKYVNDTLGHSAGDELIACVAGILGARLRRTDTVARLGGDEFAIVLPRVDEARARAIAGELLEAIRHEAIVSTPKGIRRATASIGIALFPSGPKQLTSEELLIEADIAMYDAKEAGRDQACLFDEHSSRQLSLEARMTWSEQIREALDEGRFTLYAQPIVPLLEPARIGVTRHELLVRMVSREGDIIPPGAFLPVAERFDLIQEIDRWVVRNAIELLAEHERAGQDSHLEVNLSAKSLVDPQMPAHIAHQLAIAGVDPSRLIFEVTETAAIVNVERAKQFAHRLGELGCGFALDDFGAGFASFYYLKHLPFHYLKIDGEFVEKLLESRTNQLVVKAVVAIAQGLGKQTIAEYVGDARTLELLREYGVDFAQGFHVGRPRPVAEIGARALLGGVNGG